MRRAIVVGLLAFLVVSVGFSAQAAEQPKYVFLFIGDGMGPDQVQLGQALARHMGRDGLVMLDLPAKGDATTRSANSAVTDSAAAGTALATGHKTNNGMIGVLPDGKTPVQSMAALAHAAGRSVGVVSSVSIDHATPASFYAHNQKRGNYEQIAAQLPGTGFEYFGGGTAIAAGKGDPTPVAAAETAGYTLARDGESLLALKAKPGAKVWAFSALKYDIDRPKGEPTLAEYTAKGIELLSGDPEGFFMMVEGGRIDWACHSRDAGACAREVVDFDDAISQALAFQGKHPGETLIVVTADHETGGLGLDPKTLKIAPVAAQTMSLGAFGGKLSALRKDGVTGEKLLAAAVEAFGFGELNEAEKAILVPAANASAAGEKLEAYGKREPLTTACQELVSQRSGCTWTTYGHSARNVPVLAIGVGQERFARTLDNTELSRELMAAMGVKPTVASPPTEPAKEAPVPALMPAMAN